MASIDRLITPKDAKSFYLAHSLLDLKHCQYDEVNVLHLTSNIKKNADGAIVYEKDLEFVSPVPKAFEVDEDNPYFTTRDGVLFSKDMKTLVAFPKKEEDYGYFIPEGVLCIGVSAFQNQTHLVSIHIPNSVETIETHAFLNCTGLKNVVLPQSLKNLAGFTNCYNIESFCISEENPQYTTIDGVLFSKDMKRLLHYPSGKKEYSYQIPEGVEIIESWAFSYVKNLQSIRFPSTLQEMDASAFVGCEKLQDFDGFSEEFIYRMCLPKKELSRFGLKKVNVSHVFLGCPILKKIFDMRERIMKENKE